jgi:hypothetical protein
VVEQDKVDQLLLSLFGMLKPLLTVSFLLLAFSQVLACSTSDADSGNGTGLAATGTTQPDAGTVANPVASASSSNPNPSTPDPANLSCSTKLSGSAPFAAVLDHGVTAYFPSA